MSSSLLRRYSIVPVLEYQGHGRENSFELDDLCIETNSKFESAVSGIMVTTE